MHDARLNDRRRRREAADIARFRELFDVFPFLRAASAESLHALFFAPRWGVRALRSSTRMLAKLRGEGYLTRQLIDGGRSIYHLTRKSIALINADGVDVSDMLRREVPPPIATYLWLRASLLAELVGRGYRIGRGPEAMQALRRFVVDAMRERVARLPAHDGQRLCLQDLRERYMPPTLGACRYCNVGVVDAPKGRCPGCLGEMKLSVPARTYRCRRCGAVVAEPGPHRSQNGVECSDLVRELDVIPFDLAWRWTGASAEVILPFVDNPARALFAQLDDLPLRIMFQPILPIILRTTDPDSLFSRARGDWACIGPRHRLLLRAFEEGGVHRQFPYRLTTTRIDVRPDLQAHLIR